MILNDFQCKEIISWHKDFNLVNVNEAPSSIVPKQGINRNIIDYNIAEVYRNNNTQWFFDFIHNFLINDFPYNKVNEGNFFYLHRWDKGNKFAKHIDKRREDSWRLVVGATLNTDFKGGNLIAYDPEEKLATEKGKLYKMSSERLHEVTEILEGTRFSFVYFIPAPILNQTKSVI